jgi:hypothetical protein
MAHALTLGGLSPELLKVVDRAKREPEGRFHSLAHLIAVPALERAYRRQRSNAAVGRDVDPSERMVSRKNRLQLGLNRHRAPRKCSAGSGH